jgi:hypothetical protein
MTTQYIKHADGNTYYFADKAMTITHRADGPAIIGNHGSKFWWVDGRRHNPNGPAVTYPNGYKEWYINGKKLTEAEFNALTNPQPNQPMEIQYIQIENGNTRYYPDRDMTILHRLDGPAAIFASGYEAWYINGKIHRTDGPAVIGPDGYEAHYINDKLHNPDGPAVIYSDGSKSWYINGKELTEAEFNEITKPNKTETMKTQYIQIENGFTFYYSDKAMAIYHRLDGPAFIDVGGYKAWYVDGRRHNPNGPAITSARGYKEWWINGKELTKEEFDALPDTN